MKQSKYKKKLIFIVVNPSSLYRPYSIKVFSDYYTALQHKAKGNMDTYIIESVLDTTNHLEQGRYHDE